MPHQPDGIVDLTVISLASPASVQMNGEPVLADNIEMRGEELVHFEVNGFQRSYTVNLGSKGDRVSIVVRCSKFFCSPNGHGGHCVVRPKDQQELLQELASIVEDHANLQDALA